MLTFSLNNTGGDTFSAYVWDVLNSNLGYFKKFNHSRWEEAVQRTYIAVVENRNSAYTDIVPYVKKLARTILKIHSNESSFGVFTDEGEISPIFSVLRDNISTEGMDGVDELKDRYKELYLLDSEAFMKLSLLFQFDDLEQLNEHMSRKDYRIKGSKIVDELRSIIKKYSPEFAFGVLYQFFEELPMLTTHRETGVTKEVNLRKPNISVINKIPDTATIRDSNGEHYFIDKNNLTMVDSRGRLANPEFFSWDIVGNSFCDILRIDITPFMDYMYEMTFVDEGTHNRHITWCGNKYSLVTPAGQKYISIDREKFYTFVRVELVMNLLMNNIGSLVALSLDNVYIKPTRAFKFDKVRLRFADGKIMDLPIKVYKKKRKAS